MIDLPGQAADVMLLPSPAIARTGSLGDLIARRRSGRQFGDGPITLEATAQLLWAAQGITAADGNRAVPSAGALYPLEIIVVAGRIRDFNAGLYRYRPQPHALARLADGDLREALAAASWGQDFVATAAAIFVICAVYQRTTGKYGQRGIRYAHLEAGHAAQNLCLMAAELGLQTVVVGAFGDADVRRALRLGNDEAPLALLPVGTQRG